MPDIYTGAVLKEARRAIVPALRRRAGAIRRASGWEDTPTSSALSVVSDALDLMGKAIDVARGRHERDRSGLGPAKLSRYSFHAGPAPVTVADYWRLLRTWPWSDPGDPRWDLAARIADSDPVLAPLLGLRTSGFAGDVDEAVSRLGGDA